MPKRNATAAVIGAGDFIGSEIAKKFAAEGFTVFAGRRNGDKLAPLVRDIEAAGGEIHDVLLQFECTFKPRIHTIVPEESQENSEQLFR